MSATPIKGPDFVKLIIDVRNMLMKQLLDNYNVLLDTGTAQPGNTLRSTNCSGTLCNLGQQTGYCARKMAGPDY